MFLLRWLAILPRRDPRFIGSIRRSGKRVKRAFEDKLAPQDPTNEPASILLETFLAERAKLCGASKPRNRATRKGAA